MTNRRCYYGTSVCTPQQTNDRWFPTDHNAREGRDSLSLMRFLALAHSFTLCTIMAMARLQHIQFLLFGVFDYWGASGYQFGTIVTENVLFGIRYLWILFISVSDIDNRKSCSCTNSSLQTAGYNLALLFLRWEVESPLPHTHVVATVSWISLNFEVS